jgi:hypothetical protein
MRVMTQNPRTMEKAMSMRKINFLLSTLLLLGLVQATGTQVTLELYDDFSRNRLHPQL